MQNNNLISSAAARPSIYDEYLDSPSGKARLGKYGITKSQFVGILMYQDYKCPICLETLQLEGIGKSAVDHCHSTDRVRGILCTGCNVSIGHIEKTPLERALQYLASNADIVPVKGNTLWHKDRARRSDFTDDDWKSRKREMERNYKAKKREKDKPSRRKPLSEEQLQRKRDRDKLRRDVKREKAIIAGTYRGRGRPKRL